MKFIVKNTPEISFIYIKNNFFYSIPFFYYFKIILIIIVLIVLLLLNSNFNYELLYFYSQASITKNVGL